MHDTFALCNLLVEKSSVKSDEKSLGDKIFSDEYFLLMNFFTNEFSTDKVFNFAIENSKINHKFIHLRYIHYIRWVNGFFAKFLLVRSTSKVEFSLSRTNL